MPIDIEGTTYIPAAELQEELGISRQTLWQWRKAGKVPAGHRFRHHRLLFTEAESQQVREYANHLEPADAMNSTQLKLFKKRPERRASGVTP